MGTTNGWYTLKNLAGGGAEIVIYDEIGSDGQTAAELVADLKKVHGPIDLRLNSPGGEVFEGLAIYNALKQRGNVTVYVDALAASIASVIAMAGSKVIMARHSALMIHDAHGGMGGTADDMTKMADLLDRTSVEIASVYAERSPATTADEWRAFMREETWYNADEAVKAGLADEVAKSPAAKIKADAGATRLFNLSNFKNVPDWVESVKDEGKVLSKTNLDQLHTGLTAMRKVHDAACDDETCSVKARSSVTIKNMSGMTTVGACAVACMHETMTDMAQDWLSDGTITMDEFLAMSAMITALATNVSAGLSKVGVADRECYAGGEYSHTVTETYDKGGKKVVAVAEEPAEVAEEPEEPAEPADPTVDPTEVVDQVEDPKEPADPADPTEVVDEVALPDAEYFLGIFNKLRDAADDSDEEGE